MDQNPVPDGFDIQPPEDEATREIVDGGVIECWEAVRLELEDFDIQDPDTSVPAKIGRAGRIEDWKPIYAEVKTRQFIAFCIVGLFVVWTLLGLIDFFVTRSFQLLQTGDPLLVGLLGAVVGYYFGKHEEHSR